MGPSRPVSAVENGSPPAKSPLSLCSLRPVLPVHPATLLFPLCSSASPRTDLPMGSWKAVDGRGWGRADSRSSVRQIKSDTRDLGKSDWDVMQSRWMGRGEKREQHTAPGGKETITAGLDSLSSYQQQTNKVKISHHRRGLSATGAGLPALRSPQEFPFSRGQHATLSWAGWEERWCHPQQPYQGKTHGRAAVTPSLRTKLGSARGKQNWAQRPGVAKDSVVCLLAATLVGCCEGIILASISFNLSRGFGPSLR